MTKPFKVGLLLEALPGDVPAPVRVRRALKALLRTYGLVNRLFVSEAALIADTKLTEVDHQAAPWRRREVKEPRKTA